MDKKNLLHLAYASGITTTLLLGMLALPIQANSSKAEITSSTSTTNAEGLTIEINLNEDGEVIEEEEVKECVKPQSSEISEILGEDTYVFLNASMEEGKNLFESIANQKTDYLNKIIKAIDKDEMQLAILKESEKYEFKIKSEEKEYWQCVLGRSGLFESVVVSEEEAMLSFSDEFEKQVDKFSYSIDSQNDVNKFLNFVEIPSNQRILETQINDNYGNPFFKIFETKLPEDFTYNDLRVLIRGKVGETNLRPAAFGIHSYYWKWGEGNASTVFEIEEKLFGFSYKLNEFKHIRRVMDGLRGNLKLEEE